MAYKWNAKLLVKIPNDLNSEGMSSPTTTLCPQEADEWKNISVNRSKTNIRGSSEDRNVTWLSVSVKHM